jgi:predicted ArsR family transcriptional regulator
MFACRISADGVRRAIDNLEQMKLVEVQTKTIRKGGRFYESKYYRALAQRRR